MFIKIHVIYLYTPTFLIFGCLLWWHFKSLKHFAKGLITDIETIKAAIIRDDNNEITKGNVNRLKNIKKQMYGRVSFELLRRKVVLSNTG